MAETFRIVLTDTKGHDAFETRQFDLPLDSIFPIGRASKNLAKHELMPASHNAYIDSPVISREHALLSANASSGTPHVYISDSASMHGTWLNDRRLSANTCEKLSPGDRLQFGVDVNRNDEFFLARHYKFEAQLSRPFSLGFTVPDLDSEEELVGVSERRGSQLYPLVLDDSDSRSEQSDDEREVTMIQESIIQRDDLVLPSQDALVYEEHAEPAVRVLALEEEYLDDFDDLDEDDLVYQTDSESDEVHVTLGVSDIASVGTSEADATSELEVPDSEAEDTADMAVYDKDSTACEEQTPVTMPVTPQAQSSLNGLSTVQRQNLFSLKNEAPTETPTLPPMGLFNHTFDNSSFVDSIAPPLPPRPSAAKSAPWHNSNFTAFGQQLDTQSWCPEEMSAPQSYIGSNFGDRPSLFSPAPPVPTSDVPISESNYGLFGGPLHSVQQADRLQTPPPMPVSDVTTSPNPHPGRRTKVSIEEIVEDQPPTPTSVSNSKRKADVLEEISAATHLDLVALELPAPVGSFGTDAAAQTAAVIAQRPKKQPRSVLNRVRNAATYTLLGATGAFAAITALSTLPDAFFT